MLPKFMRLYQHNPTPDDPRNVASFIVPNCLSDADKQIAEDRLAELLADGWHVKGEVEREAEFIKYRVYRNAINSFGGTVVSPNAFIIPQENWKNGFTDEQRAELHKRLNVPFLLQTLYDLTVQAKATTETVPISQGAIDG